MRSSAAKRLTISFNKVNVSFKVYVLSGYLHIAVLSHLQTEDILLKKYLLVSRPRYKIYGNR